MQAQNGVNMASYMATTAPSTAPLQLAGPSTMEPIVPINVQLVAQDTPSVIQGAKPGVSNEQTMQSTQRYGRVPYVPGPPYMAPLPTTAPLPYAAYTPPLPSTAPLPYAAMPSMSTRPTLPMGYYGQGSQLPFVPNPNCMTEREQMLQQQQLLQQQLLQERQQFEAALRASQAQPQPQPRISSLGLSPKVGDDVDINVRRSTSTKRARPENQTTVETKRARSASTSCRSPSPKRDYPRGTCTATRPSQASPKRAEHTLAPAQDFEAFKAQGPADQSEEEIIDSEGDAADPADAGLPILDNLKMSEEEQRDYDAFSLASVSVPASSKRPWRAQVDSKASQS